MGLCGFVSGFTLFPDEDKDDDGDDAGTEGGGGDLDQAGKRTQLYEADHRISTRCARRHDDCSRILYGDQICTFMVYT